MTSEARENLVNPFCGRADPWGETECSLVDALEEKDGDQTLALWQTLQELQSAEFDMPVHLQRTAHPIHYRVSSHYTRYEAEIGSRAFVPYLEAAAAVRWWDDRAPWERSFPLLSEASIIRGALAARHAEAAPEAQLMEVAKEAGTILLQSQKEGGRLLFPIPDLGPATGTLAQKNQRLYQRAFQQKVVCQSYHKGWWIDDLGGGELQPDNAEAALAILALYDATKDPVYLQSAQDAADWLIGEPMVPAFHINADSVTFLASLYRATEDPQVLEEAVVRTELGILPGQILDGHMEGRWLGSLLPPLENQFRILRGLAELLLILPKEHRLSGPVLDALELGFSSVREELSQKGLGAINIGLVTTAGLLSRSDPDLLLPREDLLWLYNEFGRFLTERDPMTFPVEPSAFGLYLQAGSLGAFEASAL